MEIRSHMFFKRFPREVGIGDKEGFVRRRVNSMRELLDYVSPHVGKKHIYVSIYSMDSVFDKYVVDIDADNLADAKYALDVVYNALPREIPKITMFSGKKGFHIYLLFLPWTVPDQATLKFMIDGVRNHVVNRVAEYDSAALDMIDLHVANPRALIRLPGTIHPDTGYHVLPVNPDWPLSRMLDYCRRGVEEYFPQGELLKPRPLPHRYMDDQRIRHGSNGKHMVVRIASPPKNVFDSTMYQILAKMVRPCIAYYAFSPDCDHFIRTQLVVELGYLGMNDSEVVGIIEKLGWSDYDRRKTMYHVDRLLQKVRSRRIVPASCSRLRSMGYCLGKRCEYYPNKHNHWWYMLPRGGRK